MTDGYDKLKPYGICIHGCIDGFSRYVVWLKADTTNSDPAVICRYYLEAVEEMECCPRRIRADFGTENTQIHVMQVFLREDHEDNHSG
jgi:hypothetical protein